MFACRKPTQEYGHIYTSKTAQLPDMSCEKQSHNVCRYTLKLTGPCLLLDVIIKVSVSVRNNLQATGMVALTEESGYFYSVGTRLATSLLRSGKRDNTYWVTSHLSNNSVYELVDNNKKKHTALLRIHENT